MYFTPFEKYLYKIKKKIIDFLGFNTELFIQLDITTKCQLNCKGCYRKTFNHEPENTEMSIPDWENCIKKLYNFTNRICVQPNFILCGGEPLIAENFLSILLILKEHYGNLVKIYVLTNGIDISDQQIQLFKQENIVVEISIDGPSDTIHDMCRGNGSFYKTINNIQRLKKNNVEIIGLVTLTENNHRYVEEFFQLFTNLGIKNFTFHRYIPIHSNDTMALTQNELKQAYTNILNFNKKYNYICDTAKPLYVLLDQNIIGHGQWGSKSITIDSTGNIKPSSRINLTLGNIKTDNIYDVFMKNKMMISLRKNKISRCSKCSFVYKCAGDRNAAFVNSGDILSEDPLCWKE